jgi:hypothetical protein
MLPQQLRNVRMINPFAKMRRVPPASGLAHLFAGGDCANPHKLPWNVAAHNKKATLAKNDPKTVAGAQQLDRLHCLP